MMLSGQARKQAAYRARRRAGVTVLRIPTPAYSLVEALIEARRITVADALDRRRVEVAAGEVLAEWARLWLQENR